MKQTGKCPKCSSSDILSNKERLKQGHRSYIGINIWSTIQVETYVCMNCGFLEEYICQDKLFDPGKVEKFRKHWKKPN